MNPRSARLGLRGARDLGIVVAHRSLGRVVPRVELMRWHAVDGSDNFGDALGPVVSAAYVKRHLRALSRPAVRRRLWSVGSVVHRARADDVVWGSGVNGNALDHVLAPTLDIRAVRGPRTAQWLADSGMQPPTAFGDPALLLPRLLPDLVRSRAAGDDSPVVVVPHIDDLATFGPAPEGTRLLDPRGDWRSVVATLASARLVLASSLHALIVAEAFGVPARMLRLSEHEALFKYRDYYESTGRASFTFAPDVASGLEMGGEAPGSIDLAPLEAAFPAELWLPDESAEHDGEPLD